MYAIYKPTNKNKFKCYCYCQDFCTIVNSNLTLGLFECMNLLYFFVIRGFFQQLAYTLLIAYGDVAAAHRNSRLLKAEFSLYDISRSGMKSELVQYTKVYLVSLQTV